MPLRCALRPALRGFTVAKLPEIVAILTSTTSTPQHVLRKVGLERHGERTSPIHVPRSLVHLVHPRAGGLASLARRGTSGSAGYRERVARGKRRRAAGRTVLRGARGSATPTEHQRRQGRLPTTQRFFCTILSVGWREAAADTGGLATRRRVPGSTVASSQAYSGRQHYHDCAARALGKKPDPR